MPRRKGLSGPAYWLACAAALTIWASEAAALRYGLGTRAGPGEWGAEVTGGRPGTAPTTRAPSAPSKRRSSLEPFESAWRRWEAERDGVPARLVTFQLVADEEFRARAGAAWRDDVAARLAGASAYFEREFRIRLVPRGTGEWTSDDSAASIHDLHRALAKAKVDDSADVVLGFTCQHAPFHADSEAAAYDRGVAYYFGRAAIVRCGMPRCRDAWPYEQETVVHEIAHLFGAWHSTDPRSVMRPLKSGDENTALDVCARTAVLAARDLDFRRGLDWVSEATLEHLARTWHVRHAPDAEFPPFQAAFTVGWLAMRDDDPVAARAALERCLDIDRRVGPLSRSADFQSFESYSRRARER